MLAANETVASHLEQRGVPSLYRIHEKPDAKRIYDFETIAASFGYSLGVGSLPVKRVQTRGDKRTHYCSGRKAPTVELPEEVHITPRMYQKLVQKIAGKPEERVLSLLMLRSLKQARYSEINQGHFALAAPAYTHFTSPIRRYPDLIIHRILKWVLRTDHKADSSSFAESAGRSHSPSESGAPRGGAAASHARVAQPPSAVSEYKNRGPQAPSPAHAEESHEAHRGKKHPRHESDHPITGSPDHPISSAAVSPGDARRFRVTPSAQTSPW